MELLQAAILLKSEEDADKKRKRQMKVKEWKGGKTEAAFKSGRVDEKTRGW